MEPDAPGGPPAPPSKVVDLASRRTEASAATPDQATDPAAGAAGGGAQKRGRGGRGDKKVDWGQFNFMLDNFVLIYPTDTAWDCEKRKQVKIANMAHKYGSVYVRMWKDNPKRRTMDEESLVFDPTMSCGPESINLYDGLAIEPQACDSDEVDVMLQLLEHLCSRCEGSEGNADVPKVVEWVLRWLALPLQRPGAKPRSALVFHGPQGTGKNLFFDVIRGIYGRYGVMVSQTEIEEKYNGWLSAKLLIIANEVVSRQELYHNKNRLKWIISEAEKIPIRTMNTDTRWEANHANLVFLSNEKQPLMVEIGDRRYLVVYTPTPEDGDLYERVRNFLQNGGAAKFFHYLLQYPLGDFHEHTRPLMTEAKEELIGLSMRPAERFMSEWLAGFLDLPVQVCAAEQLYRAFRRWCDDNGERWPPAQAAFTTDAKRWALERVEYNDQKRRLPPCVAYSVVTSSARTGPRKSVRCWLPRGAGPLNGVFMGDWAWESVEAFELPLGRFLRRHRSLDDAPPSPRGSKTGEDE